MGTQSQEEGEIQTERRRMGSYVGAFDYFYLLPEGCIANIISFTSPPDACLMSLVSQVFRSAAGSDAVWERFLPPDYGSFISRSVAPPPPLSCPSKKDLYLSLCNSPLLIDGGVKVFFFYFWTSSFYFRYGNAWILQFIFLFDSVDPIVYGLELDRFLCAFGAVKLCFKILVDKLKS